MQRTVYAESTQANSGNHKGRSGAAASRRADAPADGILKRVEEGLVELGRAAFLARPPSLELVDVRDGLLHVARAHPHVWGHRVADLVRGGRHSARISTGCLTRPGWSESASLACPYICLLACIEDDTIVDELRMLLCNEANDFHLAGHKRLHPRASDSAHAPRT